jgi:hypothetical protein
VISLPSTKTCVLDISRINSLLIVGSLVIDRFIRLLLRLLLELLVRALLVKLLVVGSLKGLFKSKVLVEL